MLFRRLIPFFICIAPLAASGGYHKPWGVNAELKYSEAADEKVAAPSLLGRFAIQAILFHQRVISPIDGPRSHFVPCSSKYTLKAIKKYGFLKGYAMGCDRLLRENQDPWVYRGRIVDGEVWKTNPVP